VTIVPRDEVRRLLDDDGAHLVDVLPADESADEHIAGAVNLPPKQLNAETVQMLNRSRPVITYCHDYL
jgi:rhodanese-related sulfurtransferase